MKHRYSIEKYACRMRPVRSADTQFIADDCLCAEMCHLPTCPAPPQTADRQVWLKQFLAREGELHFIAEDLLVGKPLGLVILSMTVEGCARWEFRMPQGGTPEIAEILLLLCSIAFDQAGLQELYGTLPADDMSGILLGIAAGAERTDCMPDRAGKQTEHRIKADDYYANIAPRLEQQVEAALRSRLHDATGGLAFHHLGVATASIEKELPMYMLLGYGIESDMFEDPAQGIRGVFLTGREAPRLELLENLPGSTTLDLPLKKGQKIYHMAFYVRDLENTIAVLARCHAQMISPPKASVYFGGRICFMTLPNIGMIELLEET